jgi:hypothetical protein
LLERLVEKPVDNRRRPQRVLKVCNHCGQPHSNLVGCSLQL